MCSLTAIRGDLFDLNPKWSNSQEQRKCGDVSISLTTTSLRIHCKFCEFFEDTLECFLEHLKHKHFSMLAIETIMWPETEPTSNDVNIKQEELELSETKLPDDANAVLESVADPLMAEEKSFNSCPFKNEIIKSIEPDEVEESTNSGKQNEPDVQLDADAEKPRFQHICRLIHYIQKHPALWNTQLGAHYTRCERMSAIESITKLLLQEYPILSIDTKYVRNKVKDLKNIYYNYNNKAKRNKNYEKYFELLHFLKGHEETEEAKNLCRVCNKEVASLPSHMLKHHCEKDTSTFLKCDACEEMLPSAELLEKHMHVVHRRYECKHCTREPYANSKSLRRHIETKHPEVILKAKSSSRGFIKERICEQCGKQFMSQITLYMHKRRVHLQLRPYACQDCPKAYKEHGKLKAHRNRVHLNNREYVCDVCTKAFFARKTLVQHKRLHSDVMNYICRVCGKAFRQAPALHSHMKTHQ